MASKLTKVTAYELGRGFGTTREGKPLYSWPYFIYSTPGQKSGDFYAGEGDARNGNGTFIDARELLQIQWQGHLKLAEVSWLIPLLERVAQGETMKPSQIFAAYEQVHGKPPPIEEWNIFV